MGVTGLWTILAPVKEHKELESLRGETLAVDLSIWVCETQSVKKMHGIVTKPHLRNLLFRVCHLTQLGVKLVFVVDGKAPELKWQEMSRRNQALGRGRGSQIRTGNRSNFNRVIKECCELLDILGIPYIQSKGEAEAMCAALNACGLVDACITNDGDAFLYGARKVYRNFTMNSKDPHVESYSMTSIKTNLGFTRQALIGAALLLGCDYLQGGVHGVGLERVVKLMSSLSHVDILKRFDSWARMDLTECTDKVEQFVRQKALAMHGFPQKEIISEFLNSRETTPSRQFSWRRPVIQRAQSFAEVKLEWPTDYTLEKVLPLVTLWDMTHISASNVKPTHHLQPHRIVKMRVRQGVSVYEVEWHKEVFDTSYPKDYYTTLEEQSLFSQCFPDVVEQFITDVAEAKTNKKKGSRKKTKLVSDPVVDELASQMDLINLDCASKPSAVGNNKQGPVIMDHKSEKPAKVDKSKTVKKYSKDCTDMEGKHDPSCNIINPISNNDRPIISVRGTSLKDQTRMLQHQIVLDSDDDESDEELFLTLTQRIQLRSRRKSRPEIPNSEMESMTKTPCSLTVESVPDDAITDNTDCSSYTFCQPDSETVQESNIIPSSESVSSRCRHDDSSEHASSHDGILAVAKIPVSFTNKTPVSQHSARYGRSFVNNSVHKDISFVEAFTHCSPLSADDVSSKNDFLEFGNFHMQTSLLTDLSLMASPCPTSGDGCSHGDEKHPSYVHSPSLFDSPESSYQVNHQNLVYSPFSSSVQAVSSKHSKTENSGKQMASTEQTAGTEQTTKDKHSEVRSTLISSNGQLQTKCFRHDKTVSKQNNEVQIVSEGGMVKHKSAQVRTCSSIITKPDSGERCHRFCDKHSSISSTDKGNNTLKGAKKQFVNSTGVSTENALKEAYSPCRRTLEKPDCLVPDNGHHSDTCLQVDPLKCKLDVIHLDESQKENCGPSLYEQKVMTESFTPSSRSIVDDNEKMEINLSRQFCFSDDSLIQEHSPAPLSLADRLGLRLTKNAQITLRNLSQK
ncbi:uncharacterized protein LOC121380345 [Gigantopelta aegis]|uniref:uncharacterized protein LOC121380345 n=1 Tax=Gigantopelta aegis TaxID=1735272 RepID=UPI001B88AA4A|nr:uncharacterized protein LOC121380345 [Gigantopelta aegis]XP_041365062.1 uncharacterized protein LOC121380345 [Gigantopelta aegis]